MAEERKQLSEKERRARLARRRRLAKRRRRMRIAVFAAFLALIAVVVVVITLQVRHSNEEKEVQRQAREAEIAAEEEVTAQHRAMIEEANALAVQYDYDGAIDLLKSIENYDEDSEIIDAIASYTVSKTTLQAVDVTKVPHIFFHSLIVDTTRCFDEEKWGSSTVAGFNAWMTTVDEFDKILQQLYDNGYVFVRMRDLVTETVDDDGTVHFKKNTSLMLPSDKKAIVLSVDDWSYYHSYSGKGFGDKAVLDENGDVKVQYTDADGNVLVGDYDVVPRLNSFLEEHPDMSYKGARGIIAMTGYNGCFGYRTDEDYVKQENLQSDQKEWLDEHPGFSETDRQNEIAEAKKIADAVKEEGWEFASHTWGHLSVTGKDVATLAADNEKWVKNVANIVGSTDTIIFAHGNDIGDWREYNADTNAVYDYYNKAGYHFYANVDASSTSWIQIRDGYFRQGRIDCDGLQMWRAISGAAKTNVFEDLFDVTAVFDAARPTPVSSSGKA